MKEKITGLNIDQFTVEQIVDDWRQNHCNATVEVLDDDLVRISAPTDLGILESPIIAVARPELNCTDGLKS